MKTKLSSILLVSYVAFTLGGCNLFQGAQDSSEEPPVAQSPQASEEEASEEQPDEVFQEPTTTGSTPQLPSTAGLIPSTPPKAREQSITPGRDNPFAVIPIQPVVREKTASNGIAEPDKLCQLEEVSPPTTIAQGPGTATPVSDVDLPPLLDPVLPIPNEARGVVVSGVLQLNGTPVAIVQAPNESVSRQVTVGASLSNGQVIVKAINVNSQRPYIVLEQYGLEIPRGVGEPAEEPVEPPTPTAPDGTPQPAAATTAPSPPPLKPNGFGNVRDLVLVTLNVEKNRINGIICNAGFQNVTVGSLDFQIEDKTTGSILDSLFVGVPDYRLEPGQKAEFDSGFPDLRGRELEDVNIEMVDWGS
ncbi:MAG: hypothetical protein QNJ64_10535 [Crocosphaera sp.]|nr:hypothetical protein [Crocosphaera sp.]